MKKIKKIFYFLIFSFCCAQAHSQMYIVTVSEMHYEHPMRSKCDTGTFYDTGTFNSLKARQAIGSDYYKLITIIDPQGNVTYECYNATKGNINKGGSSAALLNRIFNKILKKGYKLVSKEGVLENGTWYFAIP